MKLNFVGLFAMIILANSHSTAQPPWMEGAWSGVGHQIDNHEWDVILQVNHSNVSINYPSLSCSGTWSFTIESESLARGTETILEGVANCDQNVEVQIVPITENRILVHYYLRWYSDEPIAYAVLRKETNATPI